MARLEEHQQVPLTTDERSDLRGLAHQHGVTPGIFARALLIYALDLIDTDPQIAATVAAEGAASAERSRAAASAAAVTRWGGRP